MRNKILNGDFSDNFNNWLNGVAGGYPFAIDSGKAKAASLPDSASTKTFKIKQLFSLNNLITTGELSVDAVWDAASALYLEEFDDSIIADEWTKHNDDANRTITETTLLTIAVAGGTDARWISSLNEAPKLHQGVSPAPFTVICKIPAYNMPTNSVEYGIFIGHFDADQVNQKFAYKFVKKRSGDGSKYIQVSRVHSQGGLEGGSDPYSVLDEDSDIWLKIEVDASEDVRFYASDDRESWFQMEKLGVPYAWSGFFDSGMEIGLFLAGNAAPALVGTFESFQITAVGDVVFTVNLIKPSNTVVEIGSWTKTTDGSGALLSAEDIVASLDEMGNYYLELVCAVSTAQAGIVYDQSFGWYDDIVLDSAKKLTRAIFEKLIMGESIYYGGKKTLDLEKMVFGETVVPLKIDNQDPNWDKAEGASTQWIKDKKIIDT